ncbi:MAG: nucleotidyltransferase family protein [Clostridia bacterium]|nr:nucleotidyltransferase family protein [Clostridia bacterium]
MKVAGIVAEYNPFHNGHKFQIDALKNQGFTHIATAMSGNFVQRGECAIVDKWARAKQSLLNGVDLVLEIPTAFCLSPAEKYCFSAVEILNATGVVDNLCFGSESANLQAINTLCEFLSDKNTDEEIGKYIKISRNFIEARERVVAKNLGEEFLKILRNPNDILAIEYLKSLKYLNSEIAPLPIKREGVGHNDNDVNGKFASASAIREMIKNGEDFSSVLPEKSLEILKERQENLLFPAILENNERILLAKLRDLSETDFERLQDVSEGLHNRLYEAVRNADSLESLHLFAKTRRYTLARIRRLVLNAALGIYSYEKPPYIRVLGFSEKGKELLSIMKDKCSLPIVTSYADAKRTSQEAKLYFEKEAKYTDFYTMLTPKIAPAGLEFLESIVKI